MSAQDSLSPLQFGGYDPRPDLRMTEPEFTKYPKQAGVLGRARLAYASVRTVNMDPMAAQRWGAAHGYDGQRLAYHLNEHAVGEGGHVTSRSNLPKSTRNGW